MRLIPVLFSIAVLCAQAPDLPRRAQEAATLVSTGRAGEAIPIYEELIRAFPNNSDLLLNLSIAEFQAKRFRESSKHAEAVLKLQPGSLAAELFLAAGCAELGEYDRALPVITRVLAVQPNNRNARFIMADSLLALGRHEEAVVQFQKTANLAPSSPKVWFGLGRSFEELSSRMSQKLEATLPDSPYWLALAGDMLVRQKKYGAALASYRRALQKPSALRGLHASVSAVYRQTGHSDWAALEDAAESKSTPPDCSADRLACDFSAGRFEEVVASGGSGPEFLYWASRAYANLSRHAYGRLEQLPPSLETHIHLARELDSEGRNLEAAGEWREALKPAPDKFDIQFGLLRSLYRGQNFEEALPLCETLTKNHSDSSELNFLCGASLVNLERPKEAISYLEAALRLDPQLLPSQAALGHALLLSGEAGKAIAQLRAALPADQDGTTHFQLFRAYQITGQAALARQALAEYQRARAAREIRQKTEETEVTPP